MQLIKFTHLKSKRKKGIDRKQVILSTFLSESRRVVQDGRQGSDEYIPRAAH
jgi:hypothetical protein